MHNKGDSTHRRGGPLGRARLGLLSPEPLSTPRSTASGGAAGGFRRLRRQRDLRDEVGRRPSPALLHLGHQGGVLPQSGRVELHGEQGRGGG